MTESLQESLRRNAKHPSLMKGRKGGGAHRQGGTMWIRPRPGAT